MTIEGERDYLSGVGQTEAATSFAGFPRKKLHHCAGVATRAFSRVRFAMMSSYDRVNL